MLSLCPPGDLNDLKKNNFNQILANNGQGIANEIVLTLIPVDLADDKPTLVQQWLCAVTQPAIY